MSGNDLLSEEPELVAGISRGPLRLYAPPSRLPRPAPDGIGGPLLRAQTPEGRNLLSSFAASRPLGLYVSGRPGTGKSTLFLHLVLEDIRLGRGCCLIDPHGDLVAAVLERCPADPEIVQRILVFDPADTEHPIGLDCLGVKSERERELAVQFMLSLYETLFLPDHQGPMLHQSLGNGMRLLMEQEGSLVELPALFLDEKFLRGKLERCQNPWVRQFFQGVWLGSSRSSRADSFAYFTSKLARFLDDPMLRNILGQKGGPDLGAHLNRGGVVLARLSSGAIGKMNARLLGMMLLHKLEAITRAREGMPPSARPPLHIYVDEFHELVTEDVGEFLSCARKYGVGLHLAHQRMEMLGTRIREAILGTLGHWIFFRQGGGSDLFHFTSLLWPRFCERDLLSVSNYETLVRVTGSEGTGRVGRVAIPAAGPILGTAAPIEAESRLRFGQPRKAVEVEILERMGWARKAEDTLVQIT